MKEQHHTWFDFLLTRGGSVLLVFWADCTSNLLYMVRARFKHDSRFIWALNMVSLVMLAVNVICLYLPRECLDVKYK